MFAEDAGLLPRGLMRRLAGVAPVRPRRSSPRAWPTSSPRWPTRAGSSEPSGSSGSTAGSSPTATVLPLTLAEINLIDKVSRLDWSQVEPAIFGTLFERGLDPSKRSQLGAHYTDRGSIMRLIEPVLLDAAPPRLRGDEGAGAGAGRRREEDHGPHSGRTRTRRRCSTPSSIGCGRCACSTRPAARATSSIWRLQALKDLEREAILWASLTLKVPMQFPEVGPQAVLGIELNPYAAELARVVIWIGEIQWMLVERLRLPARPDPPPAGQHRVPRRRARPQRPRQSARAGVAGGDGHHRESAVPGRQAHAGEPGRRVRGRALRASTRAACPGEADLVSYWHEKARAMIEAGKVERVGLLATQGIRGGANRRVLERIKETGDIFLAWSDEPWVVEGAAVHVSFVGYDDGTEEDAPSGRAAGRGDQREPDGGDRPDPSRAGCRRTSGIAFMGDTKGGPFDISADVAAGDARHARTRTAGATRMWFGPGSTASTSPGGRGTCGSSTSAPTCPIEEAALYEAPFEYVKRACEAARGQQPARSLRRAVVAACASRGRGCGRRWRASTGSSPRRRLAKHRLFVWLPKRDRCRQPADRLRPRRRLLLRRAALVGARAVGPRAGHAAARGRERLPVHAHDHLRDLPVPRPDRRQPRARSRRRRRRSTSCRNGWLNPPG